MNLNRFNVWLDEVINLECFLFAWLYLELAFGPLPSSNIERWPVKLSYLAETIWPRQRDKESIRRWNNLIETHPRRLKREQNVSCVRYINYHVHETNLV